MIADQRKVCADLRQWGSVLLAGFVLFIYCHDLAWAGVDWLKKAIKPFSGSVTDMKQVSLDSTTIGAGLKEALRVGIDKTIALTGKTDGFFRNQDIKINMPGQLRMVDKALRVAGFGPRVDEFVLSMNRAAEQAAPLARDIFIDAVAGMTINDAQGILQGGDTAATQYFQQKTSHELQKLFEPVISRKLAELGGVRRYNDLLGKYRTLPFAGAFPAPDIEDYVVDRSLHGIFLLLGQQEQAIRQDPAMRVTDLLRQVFR